MEDYSKLIDNSNFGLLTDFLNNLNIQEDGNNDDIKDIVFYAFRRKEKECLKNSFKELKQNFQKQLEEKDNKFDFEFKIKSLIEYEDIKNEYEKKIINKINHILMIKKKFKIDYISVLLIGKSGVGKSTLINEILELPEGQKAKEGIGTFVTQETRAYKNGKVPYLRLIDTRGIELTEKYNIENIKDEAAKYIRQQIEEKPINTNNFIQCIWYCLTGDRFEDVESKILSELSTVLIL